MELGDDLVIFLTKNALQTKSRLPRQACSLRTPYYVHRWHQSVTYDYSIYKGSHNLKARLEKAS
jgi:hypothetical protein